jgi:hypothetical protein
MLSVAASLAKDFEYVRVDLYTVNDRIYFGELTFTPGAGVFPMEPEDMDYQWGRLMSQSLFDNGAHSPKRPRTVFASRR